MVIEHVVEQSAGVRTEEEATQLVEEVTPEENAGVEPVEEATPMVIEQLMEESAGVRPEDEAAQLVEQVASEKSDASMPIDTTATADADQPAVLAPETSLAAGTAVSDPIEMDMTLRQTADSAIDQDGTGGLQDVKPKPDSAVLDKVSEAVVDVPIVEEASPEVASQDKPCEQDASIIEMPEDGIVSQQQEASEIIPPDNAEQALQQLKDSAAQRDRQLVQDAIWNAQKYNVDDAIIKEYESLMEVFAQEEQQRDQEEEAARNQARNELKDAMEANKLTRLRNALSEAEKTGVERQLQGQAKMAIDRLVSGAGKALTNAMKGLDPDVLREAIGVAEEAHCAKARLVEAYERLDELVIQRAAREAMQEAMQGESTAEGIEHLTAMIKKAEEVGVDYDAVYAGRQLLVKKKQEKRTREAREALIEAINEDDYETLNAAIEKAVKEKVQDQELIDEAREVLSQLRQYYKAKLALKMLQKGEKARHAKILRLAIKEAEEALLDESNIIGARAVLMEVDFEEALRNPIILDDTQAEEALEKPILLAEEKGVPGPRRVWGIHQMLSNAEADSLGYCECCMTRIQESFARASRVLARLEYKVDKQQASIRLTKAVAGDSIDDIRDCIVVAVDREVDPSEVATAKDRIIFLAERARASAELTVAMAGDDLLFLQWAVAAAETTIADEGLLTDAKAKLADLESKARSAELFKIKKAAQLRAAVFRGGKSAIDSVDEVSQDVRDAGFAIRVVKPSGDADRPETPKAKITARDELRKVLGMRAAKALETAIKNGKRAGIEHRSWLNGYHQTQRLEGIWLENGNKKTGYAFREEESAEAERGNRLDSHRGGPISPSYSTGQLNGLGDHRHGLLDTPPVGAATVRFVEHEASNTKYGHEAVHAHAAEYDLEHTTGCIKRYRPYDLDGEHEPSCSPSCSYDRIHEKTSTSRAHHRSIRGGPG